MGKFNDLTGSRFGLLTVVSIHGRVTTSGGTRFYTFLCRCDCGNEKICRSNALVSGRNISCGCKAFGHVKHGLYYHPLYKVWTGMVGRCHNTRSCGYKDYGARGIYVCAEWRESVVHFINYMESIGWVRGVDATIDRIDNDGGYEPGNIRLATKVQQARNFRRNTIVEMNGRRAPIAQWAEELGIPYGRLQSRIYRGWSPERALSEASNR